MAPNKAVCPTCKKNITKQHFAVQCLENCKQWYHLHCANLTEVDLEVMKKTNNKWFCLACKKKIENKVRTEINESNVRKSIGIVSETLDTNSYSELTECIRELKLEIRDLKKDIKFYAEQYEEQRAKNDEFQREIQDLKSNNLRLNEEIDRLKGQAARHERVGRQANIVIVGVEYQIGEGINVSNMINPKVEKILKYVSPNLNRSDVVIKVSNMRKENCPVIVEFKSKEVKKQFLEDRKQKGKVTTTDCGLAGESLPLYFNEDLNAEERRLFKKARELKTHGFKYVWVRDNNILVRQADTSAIIRIKSDDDIEKLSNQVL